MSREILPFQFNSFEERDVLAQHLREWGTGSTAAFSKAVLAVMSGQRVIDAVSAAPRIFDQISLQGRIALVKPGEILFSDKLANVAAARSPGRRYRQQ